MLLSILYPRKKRLRIERKRRIVYLYAGKQLHLTEIEKLSCPLSQYLTILGCCAPLVVWVHPYIPSRLRFPHPKSLFYFSPVQNFAFVQVSMLQIASALPLKKLEKWALDIILPNTILSTAFTQFLDPDTTIERLAEFDRILTTPPTRRERLRSLSTDWIGRGLFCRRFPNAKKVERDLADYFTHTAPTISVLPSWHFNIKTHIPGYDVIDSQDKASQQKDFYRCFTRSYVSTRVQYLFQNRQGARRLTFPTSEQKDEYK